MSYQVLARKWRPHNFSSVVGQQHILTALENSLSTNRLHHAYLFSGTRGVGKTSIARLFAKGLNCENSITATPCDKCSSCIAINEGNSIDLLEIDAASRTKVEDTRELLDNVQYKPVNSRFKIYLIDEVHMLSRHSFNALLKTLEEPPEYVKFLLATTEPQKLPVTILSRCIQFQLKALTSEDITKHLTKILQQEKIEFTEVALEKIAKAAKGSVRDALSLTDQAIALSNANISLELVNMMLGLLDDEQAVKVIYALARADGNALMELVQKTAEKSVDWDQFLQDLATILHRIALQQLLTSEYQIKDSLTEHIKVLAKTISAEDLQLYYQIILIGRKELSLAPDRRTGVEMTLLRALAFHPTLVEQQTAPSVVEKKTLATEPVTQVSHSQPITPNDTPTTAINQNVSPASHSGALASILQAKEELKTKQQMLDDTAEKKKPLVTSIPEPINILENIAELSQVIQPILDEKEIVNDATAVELIQDAEIEDNELSADYQWQWVNPEINVEQKSIRPSEIKQAILEQKTPELQAKILRLSQENDKWTKILMSLELPKLVLQIGLNSCLVQENETQIVLGLRSKHAHLNKDAARDALQQALIKYYQKNIELIIEPNDDLACATPLDIREQIFMQLREQAKEKLLAEATVKKLQQEFAAEIDMDSINPVG